MRRSLQHPLIWISVVVGAGAATIGALLAGSRPVRAQAVPPGLHRGVPAGMKRYVETVPGTDVTFEMVPIPGGTFTMGSPPTEPNRAADEGPQHLVALNPFWMGKTEVTWDEYDPFAFSYDIKKKQRQGVNRKAEVPGEKLADAITRPTPPYADETFGLGRHHQPVICITHHAAMEYCRWLSAKTGHVYRLPTEAEWEYACRAGSTTAYSFGNDPRKLDAYAWYFDNSNDKPHPVAQKNPNAWGLYDMHGNAAEWCLDHYKNNYTPTFTVGQIVLGPVVMPDVKQYPYVVRGGSWDDEADKLRSAARRASNRDWSIQDPQRPQSIWWHTDATFVGFRVVRALNEPKNLRGLRSWVVKGKG